MTVESKNICKTCGTQFPPERSIPAVCPICADERQWVPEEGQQWISMEGLRETHHNVIRLVEPNLYGIQSEPGFAISQQAYLVQTAQGNIMWDCTSLIDQATIDQVQALGGITAITCSHPHFYGSMVEWSHAFGDIPVYLPAADRQWVMRPDPVIQFWEGDQLRLNDAVSVIRCGGHFDGSSVLHWALGAENRGVLLTTDTIYVTADRRATFMYSYPNSLPLSPRKVRAIADAVKPLTFDRIYSGWPNKRILDNAKTIVMQSAERYIQLITEDVPEKLT